MPFNNTDKLTQPQAAIIQAIKGAKKTANISRFQSLRLYPCFYCVKYSIAHAAQGAKGKQELEIRAVLYNIYFLPLTLLTAKAQGSHGGINEPLSA